MLVMPCNLSISGSKSVYVVYVIITTLQGYQNDYSGAIIATVFAHASLVGGGITSSGIVTSVSLLNGF
jgi:hypothetical protein